LNVCIIPARAGSKGIKGKNIKPIAGQPLIAHSILFALNSQLFDDIFVLTDDPQIAEIAKKYGADIPYLRSRENATDTASTESVINEFVDWCTQERKDYTSITLLQPTSPLRKEKTLRDILSSMKDHDSALTVVETHAFFWSESVLGNPKATYDIFNRPRRQDIKQSDVKFRETGSIYSFKLQGYKKHKNRLFGKIALVKSDEVESYEIDTDTDFTVLEALMREENDQ